MIFYFVCDFGVFGNSLDPIAKDRRGLLIHLRQVHHKEIVFNTAHQNTQVNKMSKAKIEIN